MNKSILNSAFFFVGLSAAGKTTLAKLYKKYLDEKGYKTFLFDGNEMSNYKVLRDYEGFDITSRYKRGLDLANLVNWIKSQGIIPIVAVIGQPKKIRKYWRNNIIGYKQIYIKCDLKICIQRDNKNIYKNESNSNDKIVGKDIKFEEPKNSDLILNSGVLNPKKLFEKLINHSF